jgi:hypothetical protein
LNLPARYSACLLLGLLVVTVSAHAGQGAQQGVSLSPSELRTGFFRGQIVTYRQVGDLKIVEGDMLLDHVDDIAAMTASGRQPNGLATAESGSLWPKAAGVYTIPYVVTAGNAANIKKAVTNFNAVFKGLLKFVPRAGQHDYVNFDLTLPPGNSCYSFIGDIHSGSQAINGGSDCPVASLMHEMGHAVGLYHEQSRFDRDTFLSFFLDNVIDGQESQFAHPVGDAQDIGGYDYGSIMHYYPQAFSRNGGIVMESKPAGIEFGEATTYSAGDIDTIERIYHAAPKTVTIASVPSGATVLVDGVATKTPKAFAWALNSKHTLAVAAGAQAVGGEAYIYGRWSDSTAASHSITVKPGGGTPATPATSPAVGVYTAAFIHLVKFAPQVSIIGEGTVTGAPAAKAYTGVSGKYYPARLPVTYTAHPAAGYIFAGWFQPTPSGSNPVKGTSSDYVFAYVEPTGTPLTTIKTAPAGVGFLVDGQPAYGPSLFAWDSGSMHSVSIDNPYGSPNTRSVLVNWSDKGAASHTVTATSTSRTLTATVKVQYKPYLAADPDCAGTLKYSPASADGFYNSGAAVTVTPTPAKGWVFAGWTEDMVGQAHPAKLKITGEIRGNALFNAVGTPLKITGFSPATLPVGSSTRALALNGTGFTAKSVVFVNGLSRNATFVSATRLNVPLTAADLAAANALDVQVTNGTSGLSCSVYDRDVFFITKS